MYQLKLGDYQIGRIAELEFPAFPAREFLPAATEEIVAEARRQLPGRITPDGKVVMSFHSFLLKTSRHTIMIDTCCGVDKPRPGREHFNTGKQDYLGGLAASRCQARGRHARHVHAPALGPCGLEHTPHQWAVGAHVSECQIHHGEA